MMIRPRMLAVLAIGAALVCSPLASQATAERPADPCHIPVPASAARGAISTDPDELEPGEQARVESRTAALLATKTGSKAAPIQIQTYIHVMRSSSGAGDVSDAKVQEQLAELNEDYSGGESPEATDTGFRFVLAGVDKFDNDTWHTDGDSTTYRTQTRKGGKNALNIWLVNSTYGGIATFPWEYAAAPAVDGIRVHYLSLPGGPVAGNDLGKTATHEAGHWLGLYHTFINGCTTTNDEVTDTPAQSGPSSGCPANRDSCTLPGKDPIHNYMDYSDDSCLNQFTPGQAARMVNQWTAYRS